jgi:uncharacterized membrane protein
LIFLTIIVISYIFLYRLVIYHWESLHENYNFVVGNISIRPHMQML